MRSLLLPKITHDGFHDGPSPDQSERSEQVAWFFISEQETQMGLVRGVEIRPPNVNFSSFLLICEAQTKDAIILGRCFSDSN
jgi:hypothetical protein